MKVLFVIIFGAQHSLFPFMFIVWKGASRTMLIFSFCALQTKEQTGLERRDGMGCKCIHKCLFLNMTA